MTADCYITKMYSVIYGSETLNKKPNQQFSDGGVIVWQQLSQVVLKKCKKYSAKQVNAMRCQKQRIR